MVPDTVLRRSLRVQTEAQGSPSVCTQTIARLSSPMKRPVKAGAGFAQKPPLKCEAARCRQNRGAARISANRSLGDRHRRRHPVRVDLALPRHDAERPEAVAGSRRTSAHDHWRRRRSDPRRPGANLCAAGRRQLLRRGSSPVCLRQLKGPEHPERGDDGADRLRRTHKPLAARAGRGGPAWYSGCW